MRKILGRTIPFVAGLGLSVGAVAGTGAVVGHLRHSQDSAWCRTVTPTMMTIKGQPVPVPAEQLATARVACAAERRAQRGLFGAVWKTGGKEMAGCGIDWGRYQQLSGIDPAGAAAVTTPLGITGPLDEGSTSDEHHFITACLAAKHNH